MKNNINHIRAFLSNAIEEAGYRPVRYKLRTGVGEKILQIMIEYKHAELELLHGDGGITAEDCTLISRMVSELLDQEDLIIGEYRLEISSPGIDRPLETKNDFRRYIGFLAKLKISDKNELTKHLTGKIIDVINNDLIIGSLDNNVKLNVDDIISAKLVLNDELLSKTKSLNREKTECQMKEAYDE